MASIGEAQGDPSAKESQGEVAGAWNLTKGHLAVKLETRKKSAADLSLKC